MKDYHKHLTIVGIRRARPARAEGAIRRSAPNYPVTLAVSVVASGLVQACFPFGFGGGAQESYDSYAYGGAENQGTGAGPTFDVPFEPSSTGGTPSASDWRDRNEGGQGGQGGTSSFESEE